MLQNDIKQRPRELKKKLNKNAIDHNKSDIKQKHDKKSFCQLIRVQINK